MIIFLGLVLVFLSGAALLLTGALARDRRLLLPGGLLVLLPLAAALAIRSACAGANGC